MQQEFVFYGRPKYKGVITLNGNVVGECYLDDSHNVINETRYCNGEITSSTKKSSYTKEMQGVKFYVNECESLYSRSIYTYDEMMRLVSSKVYDLETNEVCYHIINTYVQDTNIIAMHQDIVQQETVVAYYDNHVYTYIDMNNERVIATYSDLDEKCVKYYDKDGNVIHTNHKAHRITVTEGEDDSYTYCLYNDNEDVVKYLAVMPDEETQSAYINIQNYVYDDNNREIYSLVEDNLSNGERQTFKTKTSYNDEGLIEKEICESMHIDLNKSKTVVKEEYIYQWTEIEPIEQIKG